MPPKRAASPDEDFFEPSDAGSDVENAPRKPATKRARKSNASTAGATTPDVSRILALKNSELKKCEHDELVGYVEALQQAMKSKSAVSAAPAQLSDEQLDVEVEKATNLMIRAMTRSMTWKVGLVILQTSLC